MAEANDSITPISKKKITCTYSDKNTTPPDDAEDKETTSSSCSGLFCCMISKDKKEFSFSCKSEKSKTNQ